MKFRVKNLAIGTGNTMIALINYIDADKYDLHFSDRVRIRKGKREIIASIDITDSHEIVLPGQIGLFEEVYREIRTRDDDIVTIHIDEKPLSLHYIRKKLDGHKLKYDEMKAIVDDLIKNKLTDVELAYFVASTYMHEMTVDETVALTRAIVKTGETLRIKSKIVVDKHCIGGVAGNRTTMMLVPIVAAAGLVIPKTSSRAITSAAGTSDTVEVLCDVCLSKDRMESIVNTAGGCLVWGGAVNLAPADDKIIRVERPLSLDPLGQLLASILAKKKSVSATHLIIDIPIGRGSKTESKKKAYLLKRRFENISKKIGINTRVVLTDGTQPVGNGIGPALEARDVLWTLQNSVRGANDLKEKSIMLAGEIFDMVKKTRKGEGKKLAREIVESGKAYLKFIEIIKAQDAKIIYPEQIDIGEFSHAIESPRMGRIAHVDNKAVNRICRIAGAPHDHGAGIYLEVHKGDLVKKRNKLFTIYSNSKERLKYAVEAVKYLEPIEIKAV
ncbi:AMP phosphorylase [Candidatus Woesearchaeota archaeon]|nr:AMP phosphorylase [Candidatus Woesearchaeota archaeon]